MSDQPHIKSKPARKAARSPAYEAKRARLALLVAAGVTVTEAAAEVGTDRGTAADWLAEPEVAELVASFRRSSVDEARRALAALAQRAVMTLGRAIDQGDTRAAIAVLDRVGLHARVELEPVDLSGLTLAELGERAREISSRIAMLELAELAKLPPEQRRARLQDLTEQARRERAERAVPASHR